MNQQNQRLLEIIQEELLSPPEEHQDERASWSRIPRSPGEDNPSQPRPTGMWELQNQTASLTRNEVREACRELRQRLFILSKAQTQLLQEINPPHLQDILSLWGRSKPQDFSIRQRLETIGQTLPHDRDWRRWWIDTALQPGSGIQQPHHDNPVAELLDQVIRTIAQHALPNMPNSSDIAWHIAAGAVQNPIYAKYFQPQTERVPLSSIIITQKMMHSLAERLLISPGQIPDTGQTPEQIQDELETIGIETLRDTGTLTTLAQLREDIGTKGLDAISISPETRLWCRQNIPGNEAIVPWRQHHAPTDGKMPPNASTEGIPGAEIELIILTAPSRPDLNPRDSWTTSQNARIAGYLTHTYPEHVTLYMSGQVNQTRGVPREQCPFAQKCPTYCGQAQTMGEFPFPMNQDGKYESCRYYQFLKQHGEAPPSVRDAFAQLSIQTTVRALAKRQREEKPERLTPGNRGEWQNPGTRPAEPAQNGAKTML